MKHRDVVRGSLTLIILALLAAGRAHSQAVEEDVADPLALQVHGFVSQGFLITTENNYLAESERGSFEFSEVGINFTKSLTDDLRVGLQLFARDLGPVGNYDAQLDWFYVDYRAFDWLGFRAGRVKLPFGLYNEINDVDAARTFVLLPQSIYPTKQRDYLLAQTGVELYGYASLGAAGALDYRLFGGSIFLDDSGLSTPGSPFQVTDVHIPFIVGGRLLWETPLPGLRAGASVQVGRLDIDVYFDREAWLPVQMAGALPQGFDGNVATELPVAMWVGSVEYSLRDLTLAAEYSRWSVEIESSAPALVPEDSNTSERMFALASYRLTTWLQPGVYYSLFFTDVTDRDRRSTHQHDTALTLRFDLNAYWLLKLEGHYLHGTAQLEAGLNGGTPRSELEPDWFLFLAKTTAYF